jgi:Mg-chelatase subunit ChlD
VDLILVLDGSGSISDEVMSIREFARGIASQLELGLLSVQLGIIEFDSEATLLSPLTTDAAALELAIATYGSGGTTNIGAGVEMAVQSLQGGLSRAGAAKIMLVLSDGQQSESSGGDKAAIRSANDAKAAGVRLFSIGFGGVEVCALWLLFPLHQMHCVRLCLSCQPVDASRVPHTATNA